MSKVYQEKISRYLTYQLIYQQDVLGQMPLSNQYLIEKKKIDLIGIKLINSLIEKITKNRQAINLLISESLMGWKLSRLEPIVSVVLSVAVAEMFYIIDSKYKIIINEAIEFLNKHSSNNSSKLVNGILHNIWKKKSESNLSNLTNEDFL